MAEKTALVVGATGLVGGLLTSMLLDTSRYTKVVVLTRRNLMLQHAKLVEHIIDFDHYDSALVKADDIFCCLGTTIKVAGSREAFYRIDCAYPYEIALAAKQNGARQYLLVSAMGANKQSSIFYNRVKGETEDKIASLDFEMLGIFRPSLLLGNRQKVRIGEKAGEVLSKILSFLLIGPLKKYRPVKANKVASAMLTVAAQELKGKHIIESDTIQRYS